MFKRLLAGVLCAGAFTLSSAQGVWNPQVSGTSNILYGVAHSPTLNRFVAVGRSPQDGTQPATVLTSPDGATWTAQTANTNNGLTGVTWAGTQFVAVGYSGAIVTSPDGITWTKQTSGTTQHLEDVVWTGAQLVASGVNGTLLTSPTGVTWTLRPATTTTATLTSLAWTGSLVVVVGSGGYIATSPDGVTWTARNSGTGNLLNGVAWSGTQLVALSNSQLDGFLPAYSVTSPDGLVWTSQSTGINASFQSVAWIGTQFLGMGGGGLLRTSVDGVAWTPRTSGTTAILHNAVKGGTTIVVVGALANGGSANSTILTSAEGSTSIRTPGVTQGPAAKPGVRGPLGTIEGYRPDGRMPRP